MLILLAMLTEQPAAVAAQPHNILHYVRSNRDGSEPEHVVQYRPTRTALAVYKWVEKCTTAAYVTAEMDQQVEEGQLFVAGKVAKDGGQARFGALSLDDATSTLSVDISPPGGQRIEDRHKLQSRPYIIYDFDFADLNAVLQEHKPGRFRYEMPIIWPGAHGLFKDLGVLHGRFVREERHLGRRALRYDLEVKGPTPSTGKLWIDAKAGFIVEAELGLPNHQEYRDFRLKLQKVERGNAEAWQALTRSQHDGCPTGN